MAIRVRPVTTRVRSVSGTHRALLAIVLAGLAACGLDDLLSPKSAVARLHLTPSDTTLGPTQNALCLSWTAEDVLGNAVTITPMFTIEQSGTGKLALGSELGCLVVEQRVGNFAATVRATADTATATAIVRLTTSGPGGGTGGEF